MPKKITTEEFVKKAIKIHGDKYNYSKVEYVSDGVKVDIICRKHGIFKQSPHNHLFGQGCQECHYERRRITTEEFIDKSIKKHGDKYDYSKSEYLNGHCKIIIICKKHGRFEQRADLHLQGFGCKKCSKSRQPKGIVKFIDEARKVHGDKYDYSQSEYMGCEEKILIVCPEHGAFKQIVRNHLRGQGCKKCYGNDLKTTEEFIKKSLEVHNNFYTYEKTKYLNRRSFVIITCPKHGEFKQSASSHLNGSGCQRCSINHRKTNQEFVKDAFKIHGLEYDYSCVEYINSHKKISIICKKHGVFEQSPTSHLRGSGCPYCSIIYSKKCDIWINSFKNEKMIKSYRFGIGKKKFESDGYDPTTNTLYEFYGDMWHGNPRKFSSNDKIFYGETYGELYRNTIERENILIKNGFNLIKIWEDEFDLVKK